MRRPLALPPYDTALVVPLILLLSRFLRAQQSSLCEHVTGEINKPERRSMLYHSKDADDLAAAKAAANATYFAGLLAMRDHSYTLITSSVLFVFIHFESIVPRISCGLAMLQIVS